MCSIAMPAELILGHGPAAVYGPLLYGPLVVGSGGGGGGGGGGTAGTPVVGRSVPPQRIRPCLTTSNSSSDLNGNGDTDEANKENLRADDAVCGKRKKRVVFADDRGRPLTQVRVMSEPSNVPPLWSNGLWNYLAGLSKESQLGAESEPETKPEPARWQVTFCQPASDYLTFRRKLDEQKVCLENVIVREAEHCLMGTIKVRNLAYDKEVVIRTSSDSWKTHEDVHASYVEQPGPPIAYVLYDTFRFRLTLPINSDAIEFCVRYRTDGNEYWDNNDGANYVVVKRHEARLACGKRCDAITATTTDPYWSGKRDANASDRISDATKVNIRTWSEFAAWQHLANDSPYW